MRHHFHSHFFSPSGGRHGRRDAHFGGGRGGFFGRFGGGGRGGQGLRAAKMLASDDLQLIILLLLEQKPRHGYEIIKALEEHSSGVYTPSPGMVYPALTYLEEMGYAASESDGTKKLNQITKSGSEQLAKHRADVDEIMEQLAHYGQKMAHVREQMEQEEDEEQKWGGTPRDQAKREWRELKEEFHAIKHELKAALHSKMLSPLEEKKRVLQVLRDAVIAIRQQK